MRAVGVLVASILVAPFDPDLAGSLSLFEAIWLLATVIGWPYGLRNFLRSYGSLLVAKQPPVDKFEVEIARLFWIIMTGIILLQTGMLVVGLIGAFTPPAEVPEVRTYISLITTLMFLAGAVLFNWLSFYILRVQTRAMREYARLTSALTAAAEAGTARDELRDTGRDEGRDLVRDPARDAARDIEHDAAVDEIERSKTDG